MDFVSPSPSIGLYINLDESEIYKNKFLLDGAAIFFPDMNPLQALQQTFLFTKTVKKRKVQKTLSIARYVSSVQSRVHTSLRIAIVSTYVVNGSTHVHGQLMLLTSLHLKPYPLLSRLLVS